MNKILVILSLFIATTVQAYEGTFFKYGVGLNRPTPMSLASIKYFSLGFQSPFISIFDYQLEGGVYIDNTDSSRKSSAFGSFSPGLSLVYDYFYLKSFWGVAGLSDIDSQLGGHFQFKQDLELGLKDKRGVCIGGTYTHMSSAGIYKINRGRDFFVIKLQIPW